MNPTSSLRPRYTSFRDAGLDEALERGARLLGEAAAGVDVAVWTKDFDQLVFDVLDGRVSVDAMYEAATTCRAIERTLRAQLIGRLAGHGFETVASQWREDAEADDRFKGNALVTDWPHIRFYAGARLGFTGSDGQVHHIGTLCIIDTAVEKGGFEGARADFDDTKVAMLEELAQVLVDAIELRGYKRRALAAAAEAKKSADAADAKKRLAEVEAAAQSLRSGADAVRQKFQQLESENATLRASGNGVEFEPEDRFVYLKNLMCEYLATAPEDSARAPMERAMKAVIGFDDSDAKRLEAKKAEHAKRALGGLAVFFGSG